MTRAAAVVAVALGGLAGAGVAVVLLGGGGGAETLPQLAGRAAAAQAAIEPAAHLFGDAVSARVEVVVDRGRVDPAQVRLDASFDPYVPVGPVRRDRRDAGSLTQLRFTVPLRCLGKECVPPEAGRRFGFPAGTVLAGGRRIAEFEWPEVEVASRLAEGGGGRAPNIQLDWRANLTELPAVTYRVAPTTSAAALAGLAGVLVAAAGALVLAAVRRPVRPQPQLPPLVRALGLLHAARRRADPKEERKALDLLAFELVRSGEDDLARTASELAWARPRPAAEATETLGDRVARLIEQGRNGHGP